MSWWSAQNFCHANGKDLASISDLNCVEEIAKGKIGYCHQTKAANYNRPNISSTITTLNGAFGNNYYWLYDMYDTSAARTM